MKYRLGWMLIVLLFVSAGAAIGQEAEEAAAPETFAAPVVIGSVGQSAGAQQARVLAIRAGLDYVFEQRPESSILEGSQTLILVMGASSKGLGAAGVDIDGEIAWAVDLVARARELEMKIIAMHIEGGARRGSTSDQIILAITPLADYIVVKGATPGVEWIESEEADANADGLFSTIAIENEIGITYIAKTLDGVEVLMDLFEIEPTE